MEDAAFEQFFKGFTIIVISLVILTLGCRIIF